MRRSIILQRGAKGYGWYKDFVEKGRDAFQQKYVPPTPFDWSKKNADGSKPARPHAFFDVRIEQEKVGRIKFELAEDVVPNTVANFKALCLGSGKKFGGYKGTKIHYVQKGVCMMGGDVENFDQPGNGNHSAGESRYFKDENYIIPHTSKGLLSMASIGVHTNGSQFYISLKPMNHLNGRGVAFGRIVEGDDVISTIEKVFTFRGAPAREVVIENCGVVDANGQVHNSADVKRPEQSSAPELKVA